MYLYGASGHAKVIIDILEAMGVTIEGLLDDNPAIHSLLGYPVVHAVPESLHDEVIISIGDPAVRRRIAEALSCRFGTAIHPSAQVSPHAGIGCGSVVMQGAIVQAGSEVGQHAIINSGASVDHDCHVGDYAHIAPHATLCGNVTVGAGSWVGAGAVVIPGISIGRGVMIGAGAVVVRDIPDGMVAYGNPCRIRNKNNKYFNELGGIF